MNEVKETALEEIAKKAGVSRGTVSAALNDKNNSSFDVKVRVHFNSEGYRNPGTRYAEKMLPLLGYKITKTELKTTPAECK